VTTVFVRQGRYAADPRITSAYPPADITIEKIAHIMDFDVAVFA
jgi:hypothetical protein